jgi:hypothetical protein
MGLIILDQTTFEEIGLTIAGAVISTKGDSEIRKIVNAGPNGDEYRVIVYYDIYASADAYNLKKTPIISNKQLIISVLQYQIDVQTPFDIVFTALTAKYPSGTIYQPGMLSPQQTQLQALETKRLTLKDTMDAAVTTYNNDMTAQTTAATNVTDAQAANDAALAAIGTATTNMNNLTSAAQATLDTATAAQATSRNPTGAGDYNINFNGGLQTSISRSERFKSSTDHTPGPGDYHVHSLIGYTSQLKV